jgi:hypothetical protein
MATWQQLVVIFETAKGGGYQTGRVTYPPSVAGQDVNDVVAQYGQQGFEVVSISPTEGGPRAVLVLKRSVNP